MSLLDDKARRLLERLKLAIRPVSIASRHGAHRSPLRAAGVEFASHRPYVPGDDIRQIDWKAFGRHRQLVVRQFIEERDARVHLLVDLSGSMTRGAVPKADVARRIAAGITMVATQQYDHVEVMPFASQLDPEQPAVRTRHHLPGVEERLIEREAVGTTSFTDVVRAFASRKPRRGLVVLVSDLLSEESWENAFRLIASSGHQLRVIRVGCQEDDAPDLRGEIELIDSETGEKIHLSITPAMLASYKKEIEAHVERCRKACTRVGGTFVAVTAETPTPDLLRAALAPHGGRARSATT